MASFPTEPFPQETDKDDLVVYVEALATPDDYWLSITDASRVCRVQDVSIRRAINKGSLPVRRQRAGQNKRTRFVRASDLPTSGFPILDESAAITTEIGKVDILSIPRQQQQIVQEHQQLLASLAVTQETLTHERDQVQARFQQQAEQFQLALHTVQQTSAQQLTAATALLTQRQEQLQQDLEAAEQQRNTARRVFQHELVQLQAETRQQEMRYQALLEAQRTEFQQLLSAQQVAFQEQFHTQQNAFQEKLQAQQAAFHEQLSTQQTALTTYQTETKQALKTLASTQQEAFLAYQQTVHAHLQHITHDLQKQITLCQDNLLSQMEAERSTAAEQLNGLVSQVTQFQQGVEGLHQDFATQYQAHMRDIRQQQTQLDLYKLLLPLLPYAEQRLATEPMVGQALADLETRLLAAQKETLAGNHPDTL